MKSIVTVLFCAVATLIEVGCHIELPNSPLTYDVSRTMDAQACGQGVCVTLQGEGQYTEVNNQGATTDCKTEAFSFDASSSVTLTVSTSRKLYPGDPALFLTFNQSNSNSSYVQNPWHLSLSSTDPMGTGTWLFVFRTAGTANLLQQGVPIQGTYSLSGSGAIGIDAGITIHATKIIQNITKIKQVCNMY